MIENVDQAPTLFEHIQKSSKTELHAHMGSMATPDTLWILARIQGLKLFTKDYRTFINTIKGLNDSQQIGHQAYLSKYDLTQKIQSSPMAIENSVFDAIKHAFVMDNITKLELRFNPMLRNLIGFYDLDDIINHACIGLMKARSIYPVKAGIIISTDRSFSKEQHLILAKKACDFKGNGIIGFDVSGGNTESFNVKDLVKPFHIIKEAGLGSTIHTGEVKTIPLAETKFILKNIKPDRIGHGIRIFEDEDCVRLSLNNGTHFEVCPTSNIKTCCVKDLSEIQQICHKMLQTGIDFSLNTDGTVFLDTSLSEQYSMICETKKIFDKISAAASRASFLK